MHATWFPMEERWLIFDGNRQVMIGGISQFGSKTALEYACKSEGLYLDRHNNIVPIDQAPVIKRPRTDHLTDQQIRRKEDQHWEMAGLARQDGDKVDEDKNTDLARFYQEQLRNRQ